MAGTLPVYSPVAPSTFPMFINHHCYQVPKHCHHPRKHPLPLGSHPLSPLAANTAFCTCGLAGSGHFIQTESNSTCPFVSDFFSLSTTCSRFIILVVSGTSFFMVK